MRKIIIMTLVATMLLCTNINCVQAEELNKDMDLQTEISLASTTKSFSFTRSKSTYTIGTFSITSSTTMTLNMPKNNNTSLVSGTIYFIPTGGSSINIGYSNYSAEIKNVDLSSIPDGTYMIKIDGSAVGSSGTASVTCTIN